MNRKLAAIWASMTLAVISRGAWGHHSESPHYQLDKMVEFQGTIEAWSPSNPHASMDVRDRQDGGIWHCETQGVAALVKMGIPPRSFKRGDRVTISAVPGRRDPKACLLRTVAVENGATFAFLPRPGAAAAAPTPAQLNNSIYGTWISMTIPRMAATTSTASAPALATRAPILDSATEAGRKAMLAYDPIKDDPVYGCSPVSPLRLLYAPVSPFSLQRDGNRIVLRYEFMDAERVVYLDQTAHPAGGKRSLLGHSIGHFEGDVLVVDTGSFSPGVLQQYALDGAGTLRGVLRSEEYHLQERIRFDAATGELEVQYAHRDPKYYTAPLQGGTARFTTSPQPTFARYNCQRTSAQTAPR